LGKRDEEVRKEGGENERIGGQAATLLASWPAISSISLSTFTQIQTCPPDAPPIDKKAKAFFLFPFWNSFISFFIFSFYEMQGEKIKYAVKKDKRKMVGNDYRFTSQRELHVYNLCARLSSRSILMVGSSTVRIHAGKVFLLVKSPLSSHSNKIRYASGW
jgi:hypothetical protein